MSDLNPETSMPSVIYEALSNPSAKYASVYAAITLVLLTCVVGLRKLLGSQTQKSVKLDDIAPEDNTKTKSSTSTSTKVLPTGQSIDLDRLYQMLDEEGPYERSLSGSVEPASFVKLMRVVNKVTYKAYMPRKEELLQERLSFLRQQKMREYTENVKKASLEYS